MTRRCVTEVEPSTAATERPTHRPCKFHGPEGPGPSLRQSGIEPLITLPATAIDESEGAFRNE